MRGRKTERPGERRGWGRVAGWLGLGFFGLILYADPDAFGVAHVLLRQMAPVAAGATVLGFGLGTAGMWQDPEGPRHPRQE